VGGLLPLGAIYLLSRGSQFAIERLAGVAATDAIFANTYRGQHIEGAVQARNHWESSLKLISATSIFHASREWGFDRLDDQARCLIDHATRLASPTLREAG
jgi:hypothetical protein